MDAEHVLVLPDRDGAEEVAEALSEDFGVTARIVREALLGEDDAEDAQWLVLAVLDDSELTAVDDLLDEHDGWREAPDG